MDALMAFIYLLAIVLFILDLSAHMLLIKVGTLDMFIRYNRHFLLFLTLLPFGSILVAYYLVVRYGQLEKIE